MARFYRRFDAKEYWEHKPLCSVCKRHKVKNGLICWECKKEMQRANTPSKVKVLTSAKDVSEADLEPIFAGTEEFPSKIAMPAVTQNKLVRLFTYLEKALSLDDTIIRDFRAENVAPSPWWLGDLPNDVENLYVRPFDTETATVGTSKIDAWLHVEKKNVKPAPSLPKALAEWINDVTPMEPPRAVEKISRKVSFDDDTKRVNGFNKFRKAFEQGDTVPDTLADWVVLKPNGLPEIIEFQIVDDYWSDHPELSKLLASYVENDWSEWSEEVQKVYKANLLYDQLYALRLLLKNEGDSYELLLGQGLLAWQNKKVGPIYAPVFLTPLVLDFDASKRTIEIGPDPMYRNYAEITSVSEMDNPAASDLDAWMGSVNANPFDFWHFESLKSQANTFLNYLSPDAGDSFKDVITAHPTLTETPAIWNAPVIFVRKRNNSLWSKYAETIRRDVEQNGVDVTEFITDLIGEYVETTTADPVDDVDEGTSSLASIPESDLFFPLPWNDEQKRIAERLEANYGVVVKGPPGTGKSHTIANLISRFLAQGKSVLVTSQTSKALEVLRDKLPENIRSLAVSQLQQSAKRDDILQQSIAEISSNLGERETKFSEHKANAIRADLKRVREDRASLANEIRQYILTDSSESIEIDGEIIKPIDAAKLVSEHQADPDLAWFTDDVHFDTPLEFSEEDLKEAYKLLVGLDKESRDLPRFELPAIDSLPNEDVVVSAFASYRELSAKSKLSDDNGGVDLDETEISDLSELLTRARKTLSTINDAYEKRIFEGCSVSQSEREKWITALSKISERLQILSECKKNIIGHTIAGHTALSIKDKLSAMEVLSTKVSKRKLGSIGRMLLPANAKRILESYSIDGCAPEDSEHLAILRDSMRAQVAEDEIKSLLSQLFSTSETLPILLTGELDIVRLEVLMVSLHRIVHYSSDFNSINEFFKQVKQFSELSFTDLKDIDTAAQLIASQVARFEIVNLEKSFSDWISVIDRPIGVNRHPIINGLVSAIQKRNTSGWRKSFGELDVLLGNKVRALRLRDIAQKIQAEAPNLYEDIVGLVDQGKRFECPDNLDLAWRLARMKSWLNSIHDHVSIDALQKELERLTHREFELNSDLVTMLAWQRQIDKVTKKQRDALMAWSDAMKKHGKGTGKYANKWLHAAQDSLKEAKNAVPVWIMPLHRVAQMFSDPKPGTFDVVIFDEASQCDIRGLTIGYLGKKLLVVGDPDQISPAGIFQDQEKVFELISRFLYDIPHKDNFSITSSLFDLAKIRIPNLIQLNEHFRSVPEIIAFSNHYIYDHKLKPLRYPNPKGLLKPALVPVYVQNGYQNTNNKVNEPEANAIVERLVACLEDPNYQKRPDGRLCTFGIVSMLADDQAKYIKELILKHPKIGEKVIEERKIICGDAYAFQGDERDVMFLSMVKALDSTNPNDTVRALADKGTAQRFNVAATRARDQMFLYHSIPLQEFRNQDDWRFRLLNWFYDPKHEELKAGREALKKQFDSGVASQFSYDVGNLLIDRGYQVLPEYPVIGYRIDLVVQGDDARLAVECDGDQYHTIEKWEEDQARERQLRRAGWEFWRVTGSAFYCHKAKALDSLWEKLDAMGIRPIIGN